MGAQCHAPAALLSGNTQCPLYRRLGRPQGQSGWVRKISPPPGFDPRNVLPLASHYTYWAIPALNQPGQEVNHSPSSSAEVNNECSYACTPSLCNHGVDMGNFTIVHFFYRCSVKPAASIWAWNQQLPLQYQCLSTKQHCITAQKTVIILFTAVTTKISFYILLLTQNLPRFLASFFKPFLFSRLPILSKLPPET